MGKRIGLPLVRSIWLVAVVLLGAEVTKAGDAFAAFTFDRTPIHPGDRWFGYKPIGVTPEGTHVLVTA